MKTTVILDGAMGKKFGKKWELYVNSPAEALRMINANRSDLVPWIKSKFASYDGYEVTCEYSNGIVDTITESEFSINGEIKTIRFTPVAAGSGGDNTMKMVIGAVLMIAAVATMQFELLPATIGMFSTSSIMTGIFMMGAGMVLGGIAGMLSPQPTIGGNVTDNTRKDNTSYYFNGPTNTTMQGVPVPLTYGRCLVGSHAISVSLTVDESTL